MIDPFVILAPIFLLGVVALLGFIGCDWVLGLDRLLRPPTGLMATAGKGQITLTWTASPDAGTYKVYPTGGAGPPRGPFSAAATSFVDRMLEAGTTYEYRVSTVDSGKESGLSEPASATPLPPIAEVPSKRAKGQFDNGISGFVDFPTGGVTANNLLVAAGTVWAQGGTTINISDTLGTSYTHKTFVPMPPFDPNYRVFIAYGRALSSGPNRVTATAGGANAYCSWGIDEFSGVDPDPSTSLDTDGGGLSGGPPTTLTPRSSLTTGVVNALIVGTMSVEALALVPITPGLGYTEIAEEEDNRVGAHQSFNAEFKIVTTAGPYDVDWALGAATAWDLYCLSFRPEAQP